jgi:Flp pilus assembly protein TadG
MAMLYTMIGMTALTGVVSLAVDYARVQLAKTELQRAADSAVRTAALSMSAGLSDANTKYYAQYVAGLHTVDGSALALTSADVEFGSWNTSTKVFTVRASSSGSNALRITAQRSAARSNAVPLMWGRLIGKTSCDVTVRAVAMYVPATSTTITINPTQADVWLAGMPAGATASYDDTAPANSPPQLALTLKPGDYISFSNASGSVANSATATSVSPDGNSSQILGHGADSPGGATPDDENGVADVVMPINAILGVFLSESAPNTTSAPSRRDYSTAASRDQTAYDDIALKQPFFIGDGRTTGGTTQQFKVPVGATRLFMGTMDGHQWSNNLGSFQITITTPSYISLVK